MHSSGTLLLAFAGLIAVAALFAVPRNRVAGIACAGAVLAVCSKAQHGSVVPGVVVALFALAVFRRPRVLASVPKGIAIPGALFLLVLLFATATHHDPKSFSYLAIDAFVGGTFLIWGCSLNANERQLVQRTVITVAVIASLYAAAEPLAGLRDLGPSITTTNTFGAPVDLSNGILGHGWIRSAVTFGQPLVLSLFLLCAGSLAYAHIQKTALRWLILSTIVGGMLFAGGRSSIVVLLAIIGLGIGRRSSDKAAKTLRLLTFAAGATYAGVLLETAIQDFSQTGDLTHRLGAISAAGRLLTQQTSVPMLFGNGVFSAPRLFSEGLLQTDGFHAVDNQLLTTLAEGGVVGLVLLVWLCVAAARRSRLADRPLLLAICSSFFMFDVTLWWLSVALLGLAIGLASNTNSDSPIAGSGTHDVGHMTDRPRNQVGSII